MPPTIAPGIDPKPPKTAAAKAFKGTRLEIISDGVVWHITAFCLCDVADVSTA